MVSHSRLGFLCVLFVLLQQSLTYKLILPSDSDFVSDDDTSGSHSYAS